MGLVIDISDNVILQRLRNEAIEEGKQEGMQTVLRDQLRAKFGRVPKWASQRLAEASS